MTMRGKFEVAPTQIFGPRFTLSWDIAGHDQKTIQFDWRWINGRHGLGSGIKH